MLKNLWYFCVLISLLFTACSKINDVSNAEVLDGNNEFAIPLATATTSFQELIENFDDNTYITIDENGLIRLRYEGDVSVRTSEEILDEAVASLPTILPLSQTNPDTLPFNSPEELEVDSAVVKMGAMVGFTATRSTNMPSIASIKLTLPQVRLNGQPLVLEKNFPLGLTLLGYSPIDIGGHALVPENGKLNVEYEAYNENGELVTFGENGYALIITLEDFDFTYIEGYLGYRLHDGDRDTLSIDFFENWIQGEVYFEDPEIRINLENSFGIPTRSVINVFDIYTASGEILPLESDVLNIADNQGIDFLYPTIDQVGEVLTQTFVFDKDNSNIRDVLGSQPVALDYDVDARTNPDSLLNIRGFLTDESYYKVQVEVELPMYGWARGFIATDTFDLNFADYNDIDEVEFKLVSENGTALDIATQAYFMDADFNILDSLLRTQESLIAAASVNDEGIVIETFTKSTLIPYTSERFDGVRSATQVLLKTAFSTVNDGAVSVKVFAKDEVSIRMGMKVKTK
jgi:hypothetical protein